MPERDKSLILLVDDQPGNLLALEAVLNPLHLEIHRATSGREALARVEERNYALVVMDLVMPGLDGIQSIRLLRRVPAMQHTPILLVAPSDAEEIDLVRGYEAGATDVIHHTTTPEVLRAKVRNLVAFWRGANQRHRTEEELAEANRSLLESQRFVKALTEATPQIIFVYDLETRSEIYINSAVTGVLGFRPRQVEEMGAAFLERLIHPDDLVQALEHIQVMRKAKVGEWHEYQARFRHADGGWRWLCTRSTVFARHPDGRPRQLAGSSYDVTESKRAAEELRRLNEELELRVAERTSALEASERRARLLSEISAVLAPSVDYDQGLKNMADLLVQDFADWCVVHAVQGGDDFDLVTVACRTQGAGADLTETIRRVAEDCARKLDRDHGQQESEQLVSEIGPEQLARLASDSELQQRLAEIHLGSGVCVPIQGRDRQLGGITFFTKEPADPYSPADLEFAREVARRAAVTIENALLYQAAQAEISERRRAESARSEADQRLRGIVDNTSAAIQLKDPDGRYLLVNRQWELLTGVSAEEIIGKTPHDVYPAEIAEALLSHDQAVITGGEAMMFEEEIPSPEGRRAFVSTKFPLRDTAGHIYAVGGIATDITERKRMEEALRESEARLSAIFSQTIAGVAQVDLTGRFLHVNQRFCEILGRPMDEVLLLSMYEVTHPNDLPQDLALFERMASSGTGFVLENRFLRPDNSEVWVTSSVSVLVGQDGQPGSAVAVVQDVSDRKRVEQELHRLNRELGEARDAAVQANQAKSAFLANMSHELRTPLNAVIGYAEMIQEELLEIGQSDMARDMEKVRFAANHLLTVIADVLDLSKVEAGRMELFPEEFPVVEAVREAVIMVGPLAERQDNGIRLDCSQDLGTIIADRTRFRQILFNLLSNAAKFTEHGTITVQCRRIGSAEGDWIELEVKDTGVGMSEDQLARLFQKFQQFDDSPTRRHGGTGLGLAISKLLCDLMSGEITAESLPGQGSTFRVRLPSDTRNESQRQLPLPKSGAAARP